ncbi:MAG TPA: helix-turn-helix transcriptional regulator, partial [Planctomycetaceae bacterium]|nr:helix-turn-helix transcriptional regulator [Planctomycetaceae bacterium]
MIKNERQYRITKSQADKFAHALDELRCRSDKDPLLAELEESALESQLTELREQVEEYDILRSGDQGVIAVESFDELPQALVKARIALGLSQKDLADRLGMKEQQVQRYESTDYQSASMSRLHDVVQALGVTVREEVFLPAKAESSSALLHRLKSVGLEREFLIQRIFPADVAAGLGDKAKTTSPELVRRASASLGRIFGWQHNELFCAAPLRIKSEVSGIARFKVPSGANQSRVSAYTVYSHYLALLVLQATQQLKPQVVPVDAAECREQIEATFGELTFQSSLDYLWSLGIPVLPLDDSGAFHGAFWRCDFRNVIVLKQQTKSLARWLNDLLHELYHAGQEPEQAERTVIEASETSSERRDS